MDENSAFQPVRESGSGRRLARAVWPKRREHETRDRFNEGDTAARRARREGGRITNRPLDEEIANQRELPLRGDVRSPGGTTHERAGRSPGYARPARLRRAATAGRSDARLDQHHADQQRAGSGRSRRRPPPTPERRDLDESLGREPQPKSGRDPDLRPRDTDRVQTPEDMDATPPHGDKLLDR